MPDVLDQLLTSLPSAGGGGKSGDPLDALLSDLPTSSGKKTSGLAPVPGADLLYPSGQPPGATMFQPKVEPVASGVGEFLGLPSSPSGYGYDAFGVAASKVAKKAAENISLWTEAANKAGAYGTELPVDQPVTIQHITDFAKASSKPLIPLAEGFRPGSFLHGAASGAEQLTSPTGIVSLGGIAAAQFVPYLNVALDSYLAYQAGRATGGSLYQAKEAYDKGDLEGFAEHSGMGTFDALMAAVMIRASARGAEPVVDAIQQRMATWETGRRTAALDQAQSRINELFPKGDEPTPGGGPEGAGGGGGPVTPPAGPRPGGGAAPEEARYVTEDVTGPDGTVQQVQVKELQQSLLDHIVDEMGKGNAETPPDVRAENEAARVTEPSLLDQVIEATPNARPAEDLAVKELTAEEGGGPPARASESSAEPPAVGIVTEPPGTTNTDALDEIISKYAEPASAFAPSNEGEKVEVRAPISKERQGREVTVSVPGEKTSYAGNYEVREAADIQSSHNPFSFEPNPAYQFKNDRDYKDQQNAARVVESSSPETFEHGYVLSESPTAEHGAPVIDQTGNVLGGNNRTMTIKRVYEYAPEAAKRYRENLEQNAEKYGVQAESVKQMRQPVLVRRVEAPDAQVAITDFNKKGSAALRPAEQAVTDGKRMSPKTVEKIVSRIEDQGEGGSLADALRGNDAVEVVDSLIRDGVVTEQEKAGLLDERGFLTPEAKSRVAKALVGRLFPDAATLNRSKPAMRQTLERIAPMVLRVEGREGWSLQEPLRQAMTLIEDAQAHGTKNLKDLSAQGTLEGSGPSYSQQAHDIATVLHQNPVKAAQAFRRYANDEALSREGAQASMFEPPTQEEAFYDAFGGGTNKMSKILPFGPKLGPKEPTTWERMQADPSRKARRAILQEIQDLLSVPAENFEAIAARNAKVEELQRQYDLIKIDQGKGPKPEFEIVSRRDEGPESSFEPQEPPAPKRSFEVNPQFDRAAPLETHAKELETARSESGRSVVFLNEAGMEVVRRMLGMTQQFGALFMPKENVLRLIDNLQLDRGLHAETTGKFLGLATDLKASLLGKNHVILVRGDLPGEQIIRAIQHEEIHSVQQDLAEQISKSYHLSGKESREVLDRTPFAQRIARILIKDGYPDNPRVLVEEIAAYVFSGDQNHLQMDDAAVADFFDAYTDVLIRRHGEAAPLRFAEKSAHFERGHEASKLRKETRLAGESQAEGRPGGDAASVAERGRSPGFWEALKRAGRDLVEELRGSSATPRAWQPKLSPKEVIRESYEQEILPRLEDLKIGLPAAGRAIVNTFAPRVGVETKALDVLYGMKGKREKVQFTLERTMADIKRMFATLTQDDALDFMDRIKTGHIQRTPELQQIAAMYRQIDDGIYALLQSYKPDLNYKEDHFRIFWKRIPGAIPGSGAVGGEFKGLGHRPLEGTKGFMKRATLADVSEGIARGGVPFSYNPQVLLEMAVNDAMKYVTAHRMWDKLGEIGHRQFVRNGGDVPEGFEKLDDKIARVVHPETTDSGRTVFVEEGQWYVEANTQRLLTNYLSADLFRTGKFASITRPLLAMKNFTTALELSISPFHAMFETIEAMASQVGLGVTRAWNQGLVQADPAALLKGLKDIATAPIAPGTVSRMGTNVVRYVENPAQFKATARGVQFLKDWPDIETLIDDLFAGGAKLAMHEDYRLATYQAFKDNVSTHNYLGAALRGLPALNEILMHPLFEVYIPRLKIGLFLKEYSQQLSQNTQGLGAGEVTRPQLARETWDRVENRFGEMNFDNLFWNRTFKTFLQFWFRSVTWKMGNVRGFGTGASNQFRQLGNWGGGRGLPPPPGGGTGMSIPGGRGGSAKKLPLPYLDPGFAWAAFGLTLTSVVIANIIQLMNGEGPTRDAKDILAPRIGGVDARGKPLRVNIATYLKDLAHFAKGPKQYLTSSFSSMVNRIPEIWSNRDYFGNYIADPDDPFYEKALALFWHGVGEPIAFSSFRRGNELASSSKQQLLGAAGFTRGASSLDFTPAEQLAAEFARRNMHPMTRAEVQKGVIVKRLKEQMIQGVPGTDNEIAKEVEAGHLSARAAYEIRRTGEESYLQRSFRPLGIEQALDVWDKASGDERKLLRNELEKKEHLINSKPVEKRKAILDRYRKALGQPSSRLTAPPRSGYLSAPPA